MGYKYGRRSREALAKADMRLQSIFLKAIKIIDISVLESYRDETAQNEAFFNGKSKLKFPQSKHNKSPAIAIDAVPYPISYSPNPKNLFRYYFMAGIIKGIAESMDIKIRWGGDWDRDNDFTDQIFDDLNHFEILD